MGFIKTIYVETENIRHVCPELTHSIQPARKARGPKGLRDESASAVTGRRCPHSGEGEDFGPKKKDSSVL